MSHLEWCRVLNYPSYVQQWGWGAEDLLDFEEPASYDAYDDAQHRGAKTAAGAGIGAEVNCLGARWSKPMEFWHRRAQSDARSPRHEAAPRNFSQGAACHRRLPPDQSLPFLEAGSRPVESSSYHHEGKLYPYAAHGQRAGPGQEYRPPSHSGAGARGHVETDDWDVRALSARPGHRESRSQQPSRHGIASRQHTAREQQPVHRPSPPSLSQDSDQSLTQRWQRHRQPAPSRPDPLHSPASPSWTNRDQQAGPLEAPEAAEQQQQAVPAAGQGCSGSDWSEDSAGAAMHRSQEDLEAAEQGRPGPGSHSAAQQADARATRELKPNRASEGNWAAPAWESSSSSVELPEAAQNSTHRSTASTLELPGAAQALGQEFSAASSLDPWQAAQNVDPDSAQMQSSWSSRPPEARPPLLSSSSERSLFTAEQQAAGAEQERSASEMQDEPEQQGSNSRPSSRRSSRPEMPRSRTPSSEHEWRHPAQGKAEQAQRHQLSEGTSEASWSQPVARAGQAEAELSEASSGQLPPRAAQGAEQVSEHSWGQLSPRAARGAEQVSEDSWGQLSPRATREGPQAPPVHPPTAAPSEQLRKPSNAAPQNPAEQAAVQPEPGSTPAPEGKRRMGYWWTPGVDDAEPSELRQPKSTPGPARPDLQHRSRRDPQHAASASSQAPGGRSRAVENEQQSTLSSSVPQPEQSHATGESPDKTARPPTEAAPSRAQALDQQLGSATLLRKPKEQEQWATPPGQVQLDALSRARQEYYEDKLRMSAYVAARQQKHLDVY